MLFLCKHDGLGNYCTSQFPTRKLLLLRDGKIAKCTSKGNNPAMIRVNCSSARLASYLQDQLYLNKFYLLSESQFVLYWLHGTKELQPFVANRVREIIELTSLTSWKFCPTSDNPADVLTRGIRSQQLESSEMWKQSPSWLSQELQWPAWFPVEGVSLQVVNLLTAETTTPIGISCHKPRTNTRSSAHYCVQL